jgi:hypothetical protein
MKTEFEFSYNTEMELHEFEGVLRKVEQMIDSTLAPFASHVQQKIARDPHEMQGHQYGQLGRHCLIAPEARERRDLKAHEVHLEIWKRTTSHQLDLLEMAIRDNLVGRAANELTKEIRLIEHGLSKIDELLANHPDDLNNREDLQGEVKYFHNYFAALTEFIAKHLRPSDCLCEDPDCRDCPVEDPELP